MGLCSGNYHVVLHVIYCDCGEYLNLINLIFDLFMVFVCRCVPLIIKLSCHICSGILRLYFGKYAGLHVIVGTGPATFK